MKIFVIVLLSILFVILFIAFILLFAYLSVRITFTLNNIKISIFKLPIFKMKSSKLLSLIFKKKKSKIKIDIPTLLNDIDVKKILVINSKKVFLPIDAMIFGLLNMLQIIDSKKIVTYKRYEGTSKFKCIVLLRFQIIKMIIHQIENRRSELREKRKIS